MEFLRPVSKSYCRIFTTPAGYLGNVVFKVLRTALMKEEGGITACLGLVRERIKSSRAYDLI